MIPHQFYAWRNQRNADAPSVGNPPSPLGLGVGRFGLFRRQKEQAGDDASRVHWDLRVESHCLWRNRASRSGSNMSPRRFACFQTVL